MFILPLFTTAWKWNQPGYIGICPHMWCMFITEFYSATTQNEIVAFTGKWMELEIIMLGEISRTQGENIECFLSYVRT